VLISLFYAVTVKFNFTSQELLLHCPQYTAHPLTVASRSTHFLPGDPAVVGFQRSGHYLLWLTLLKVIRRKNVRLQWFSYNTEGFRKYPVWIPAWSLAINTLTFSSASISECQDWNRLYTPPSRLFCSHYLWLSFCLIWCYVFCGLTWESINPHLISLWVSHAQGTVVMQLGYVSSVVLALWHWQMSTVTCILLVCYWEYASHTLLAADD
jgi:hypothetical protein